MAAMLQTSRLVAAVCAAMAVAAGVSGNGAPAPAQDARTSVWDGVYTPSQAERGLREYKDHCGYCHRDDLTGGGSEAGAPALRGPIFTFRWIDQPVADLFITIGTTMPQNKPDSLTPQTVIDIVSFLLRENDVPAGTLELPPDLEKLRAIFLTAKPPRP